MKEQFIKRLIICGICGTMLYGCGSGNIENNETGTAISAEEEPETETKKAEVDFETMNYNAFLKNAAGEEVVGYHIPFAWHREEFEEKNDQFAMIRCGEYRNYFSIMYGEEYRLDERFGDTYSKLPDSYLAAGEERKSYYEENYYDSYQLEYIGETECPYGTAYLFAAAITDTSTITLSDNETEEHQHSYYDLEAVIPWGDDIILVSTTNQSEDSGKNESLIKEALATALDAGEEIREVPEGYEYYLTNSEENGEKIMGYHLPEGWEFSEYGNELPYYADFWQMGESVHIEWQNTDYEALYRKLYTDGINIDREIQDLLAKYSEGSTYVYQTELKDEVETVYGMVKIYDQLVRYEMKDGSGELFTGEWRNELGILIWNGQVFSIDYSDGNTDAADGYQGRLKELLGVLF